MGAHRDDRDHEQSAAWGEVREAAALAIDGGRTYTIHSGGRTHEVRTLVQLAEVTRRERAKWRVEWPEDPGAKPPRRWD